MAPTLAMPALRALTPTRATPASLTRILSARQVVTTVVRGDPDEGGTNLTGGAIAGIVIGSVVGFLILLWIIRSCMNLRKPKDWGQTFGEPDPVPDRHAYRHAYHHETHGSRPRHGHHHHHHHHHSRSPRRSVEIREVAAVRPVRYQSRGRSPGAPPAAYYPHGAREARRHSRSSHYY